MGSDRSGVRRRGTRALGLVQHSTNRVLMVLQIGHRAGHLTGLRDREVDRAREGPNDRCNEPVFREHGV